MGDEVTVTVFTREDRQRYREKVKRCLDVFARMLAERAFDREHALDRARDRAQPHRGDRRPGAGERARARADRRRRLPDRAGAVQHRDQHPAAHARGRPCSRELEDDRPRDLNHAEEQARKAHAHMMIIGILPDADRALTSTATRSAPTRATSCSTSRSSPPAGRTSRSAIAGVERLAMLRRHDRPRGRLHERAAAPAGRPRARSRAHWNAAQAIAGLQLAVGANSPFFFGRELWRETRIALFEQATDTRPEELKAQGVRPRVWFGERWITSIFDLFEENVRYFPALLPVCEDEDPVAVLERGERAAAAGAAAAQRHDLPLEPADLRRRARPPAPARGEPRAAGRPDRRRHRSPTPPSTTGSCACWSRTSARSGRRCRFAAAEENFHRGARDGLDARALLAGRRRGAGRRARAAPAAADGPRGARALGRGRRRRATACSGSSSAAASTARQRRLLAGRDASTASTRTASSTARTPCAR